MDKTVVALGLQATPAPCPAQLAGPLSPPYGEAEAASLAIVALYPEDAPPAPEEGAGVPRGAQSSSVWPSPPVAVPLTCAGWHVSSPAPQHAVPAHSHPSSAAGAAGFLQFLKPALHAELHTPAAHVGDPDTFDEEQPRMHEPHFVAFEFTSVSHPSVSGAVVVQSPKPALHPVYVHVLPVQPAPVLRVVSQASPQPLQLVVVFSGVSQPLRSGAVVTQSPNPGLQLEYVQVVPELQAAPLLLTVSQTLPQPVQLVAVAVDVSQPLVLLPEVSQSTNPAAQLVYVHLPEMHAAPTLVAVSHRAPQAPQLLVVLSAVSQPSKSGDAALQSPKPAAHPA